MSPLAQQAPSPSTPPQSGTRPVGTENTRTSVISTVDIVEHSPNTDALERALDHAAWCTASTAASGEISEDLWVQQALQQLEDHHITITITDYRLMDWGWRDQQPMQRGWGCYRVNHLSSGQWYEMAASRCVITSLDRATAVMRNMIALLEVLLAQAASGAAELVVAEDICDRPTEPGWPPGALVHRDWWLEEEPALVAVTAA